MSSLFIYFCTTYYIQVAMLMYTRYKIIHFDILSDPSSMLFLILKDGVDADGPSSVEDGPLFSVI